MSLIVTTLLALAAPVSGATDENGVNPVEQPVHFADFHATIPHLLSLNPTRLTYCHAGRDFRLTDIAAEVVRGVLA